MAIYTNPNALGVVTATSINFGGTALSSYVEGTFTPTVTLVGGSGNTVPVYTTNIGRSTRIGNRRFVDIYLTGDGGAEGAGTGEFTIALPQAAAASTGINDVISAGVGTNNATRMLLAPAIVEGASTFTVYYFSTISTVVALTGAGQNSTGRALRLSFSYEV